MKNGRRNTGNQKRRSTTATNNSGKSITDGSNIRSNDRSESNVVERDTGNKSESITNSVNTSTTTDDNSRIEITTGYYYTPNGKLEPIPEGYFVRSDGRLAKRRARDNNSNTNTRYDGNDRRETEKQSDEFSATDFLLEKPLDVRGKRKRKVKEETQKLSVVTLIASASAALFTSIAMLTKHEHWSLHTQEAKALAEAISEALDTLPVKYYAQIVTILEKWVPWINLCFVIGAIIIPRIEESSKRIETKYTPQSNDSDKRQTSRTEANFSNASPSIGWNH